VDHSFTSKQITKLHTLTTTEQFNLPCISVEISSLTEEVKTLVRKKEHIYRQINTIQQFKPSLSSSAIYR